MEGNSVCVEDSSSLKFTWRFENFSKLGRKSYSDVFNWEGHKWRILIFPKGNSVDFLSIYLEIADSATLPSGWSVYAKFSISVVNEVDEFTVEKLTEHTFNASESDWGFTRMIPRDDLNQDFVVNDTCTVRVKMMREEEQEKEEANKDEKADLNTTKTSEKEQKKSEFADVQPGQAQEEPTDPKIVTPDSQGTELPQIPENTNPEHSNPLTGKPDLQAILAGQPSVQPQEKRFASFSEFNAFFDDIQSLWEVQTSKVQKYPKRFCAGQIGEAEKILKQCLDMDLTCIIQSGKDLELKNSLSVVLSTNAFPDNVVSETAKFIGNFNQNCEDYEAAQRDLGEAQENENAVAELKTNLEQLVSKFMHVKSEAEYIDEEIDWLERQINDRKGKKPRLLKRAGDLAGQATTSKELLIQAEQTMKLSLIKKKRAMKTVKDFERSWESLKELHIMSQATLP